MVKLIQELLRVDEKIAQYLFVIGLVVVILLITLTILIILLSSKYFKLKKESANYKRQKDELALKLSNELLKQDTPTIEENESTQEVIEEVNEVEENEEKVVEVEDVKEEPLPEQSIQEEVVEEEKTVEEEIVEEVKVEELVVEEIKEYEEESEELLEEKSARVLLGKYEVFPVKDAFLYRLKASNGEILVVSEMYKTSKSAINAIETVKKNIQTGQLQVSEDKHGLWQFKLLATNKRLLVASANYTTQASCERAANSFKKFAYISQIVELDEDNEHLFEEIKLDKTADKKGGKIVVTGSENEYEFKLLASNGVILCSSVTYGSKMAALNAILSFKEAIKTGTFYVVKDKNNMFQFKLYSNLSRCLAFGEAYKVKAQAESAANSLAAFINMAEIVDKTLVVER